MVKVVSGVPVPTRGPGRPAEYPIETLEVGDSFALRKDKVRNAQGKIVWSIFYYRKKHQWDRKFITRTVIEGGKKWVRCWRVA